MRNFLATCQTVVGGIWVYRLGLLMDFVEFCKNVPQTCLIFSSNTSGHPVYFALHKQPFSLNFLCHVQICIAVGAFLVNSLTNACSTVLFNKDTKCLFFSSEWHFYT